MITPTIQCKTTAVIWRQHTFSLIKHPFAFIFCLATHSTNYKCANVCCSCAQNTHRSITVFVKLNIKTFHAVHSMLHSSDKQLILAGVNVCPSAQNGQLWNWIACYKMCACVSLKITELHEWACTCGCAGIVFLLLRADLRSAFL